MCVAVFYITPPCLLLAQKAALKKRASGYSNELIAEHLELSDSELNEIFSNSK